MMVYLGNEGSPSRHKWMVEHGIGNMLLANDFRYPKNGVSYALDNGAFHCYLNNKPFDELKFLKALDKVIKSDIKPDFVVLPDIVGGGMDSYDLSIKWLNRLGSDIPFYFAVQDGMPFSILYRRYKDLNFTRLPLYQRIKGIFIGGTEKWKLKTGREWVKQTHERGLKVHIGMAGTFKKMVWAKHIGADSIDSATINRNNNYERILEVIQQNKLSEDSLK